MPDFGDNKMAAPERTERIATPESDGFEYLYTNGALMAGSYLAAGSSTWAVVSDRDQKDNVAAVSGSEVLEKLAAIPTSTWNYKSEDRSTRHMGPMAQDFHAAFGLGDSDKAIGMIDADGVALAAIQGLGWCRRRALKWPL
jgi:hypothetical protein